VNSLTNTALVVAGTVSVGLGIIGVFLPLIPTTPFLLLGAACYVKGSEKLYEKLISNKLLGSYIKNYREGKGIPQKTKVYAISLLWISIGYSIVFLMDNILIRILLLLIAVCVTWHILSLKTSIRAEGEEGEVTNSEQIQETQ
jgi:uncharacterized protein